MRTIYLCDPLGMCNSYAPRKKEWIGAAIGAVGGLASSLIGGASASSAARAAERRQRELEAKQDAYYNRRYNEDFLDTAAGQNLVRRAKQMYDRSIKRAAGAKAVAGGTDASVQMAKDSANQAMGDTIANIAALDTQRKAQADAQNMAAQTQFAQMDMNREMQRAQNITNAAQNASNAMMAAGAAVDQASATRSSLNGGSNNSAPQTHTEAIDNAKATMPKQYTTPDSGKINITGDTHPSNLVSGEQDLDDLRKKIAG